MAFWIKKNNELDYNDTIFLKNYINLSTPSKVQYFINENKETERTEILEYYKPYIDVPKWLFLEEKNTLDNEKESTPTKLKQSHAKIKLLNILNNLTYNYSTQKQLF